MVFSGRLLAIFVAARKAEALQEVPVARAVPGKGLEGDRYFHNAGTWSKAEPRPDREVTLIESEALEAAAADEKVRLDPALSRRNLLTEGVPLNHLVGRRFLVGEVLLEGVKLCEPCGHMEKLAVKGAREALVHRGGLRARVVREGVLRAGDPVVPA